jgi:hypothetical protein
MARLSDEHQAFERALELQEGTAVYMGRSTIGIAADTERLREDRGPQGIRWRCYETGAAIAVLLDRLMPSWKETLDAEPDTTFAALLSAALEAHEATTAVFSDEEQAAITHRAEAAITELRAEWATLYDDFTGRTNRVVIRLADTNEFMEVSRFDPMAVEVLDRGEAIQAHYLTASHSRGELSLKNPQFARRSLEGVIALTEPAGDHPFLDGLRAVSVAGLTDGATVVREGNLVTVTADGLSATFDGALVESTDGELIITVPPAELDEQPG